LTVYQKLNLFSIIENQIGKNVAGTGVGPYVDHQDFITVKAYYQWVPFVLFLQAIMFYTPHTIYKIVEGGKIKVYPKSQYFFECLIEFELKR